MPSALSLCSTTDPPPPFDEEWWRETRRLLQQAYPAHYANEKDPDMPSATQLYNTGRWLNAADLQPLGQRRTAIVHSVEEAQVGQGNDMKTQLNLSLTSRQGQPWPKTLLLNKGNTLQMVAAYGDDYSAWPGKMIDIWSENVLFQGRTVPGIKVTAASNGNGKAVGNNASNMPGNVPSSSATAATGLPPNASPNWQPPNRQQTQIDEDEIPF